MICLYQISKYTQKVIKMLFENKMFYTASIICLIFMKHELVCKTILVTGGAGFIGATVTEALLKRGDTVVVIDTFCSLNGDAAQEYNQQKKQRLNTIQNAYPDSLHVHNTSIENIQELGAVFSCYHIDAICHLAAHAGVRASMKNPQAFIKTNIEGTTNILELAVKYGIKHCVIASSSSVYGNADSIPLTEDQHTDYQTSVYGVTKKTTELLAQVYHHLYGISISCLRFFTVYGPYGRFDMAPFIFMDAIYNQKSITVYGDGQAIRDFTNVYDIVAGIIKALDKPCGFTIFNLGSTSTVTINNFIALLEKIIGKKAVVYYESAIKADVQQTQACVDKAHTLLGYTPAIALKDGLQKMFEWYLQFYNNKSK